MMSGWFTKMPVSLVLSVGHTHYIASPVILWMIYDEVKYIKG